MANPFDVFDTYDPSAVRIPGRNPFDQFDAPRQAPQPIGAAAFPAFLKTELANADWGTRNIAGFGTALSDLWEGAKQLVGKGDQQQIQANRIIEKDAPVGSILGNVAMTAIPFGAAGNGVNTAAKIGTVMGALNPVDSDNASDIVRGKLTGAAMGGALSAAGQAVANTAGQFIANKLAALQALAQRNAPATKTLNDAMDLGLVVPPSTVNPTPVTSVLESLGGKGAVAQKASNQNAETIDALMRQEVGLPANAPLTSEAMQAIRRKAYQEGYAPIAQAGELPVSAQYEDALDAIAKNRVDASRSFPGAASPELQSLVESYKPLADRWSLGQLRDDALARFAALSGDREASRIAALQEAGKLQTEAAQASARANDFIPVPGMPRVPASLSANNELSQRYAQAASDAAALIPQRAAQRDAANAVAADLSNRQLPYASFDAGDALKATQLLRGEARAAYRAGQYEIGDAKRAISDEIENEVERQIVAAGGEGSALLENFRNARTLMAKTHDIEDAIREGGATVDARVLGRKYQAQQPLSGNLATVGAFANNFPGSVKRVQGPGISALNMFGGATLGGIAGAMEDHPGIGSVMGPLALMALRGGARSAALSKMSQGTLRDLYQLGIAPRVANSMLQYAPVAGAVLGRNAFAQ